MEFHLLARCVVLVSATVLSGCSSMEPGPSRALDSPLLLQDAPEYRRVSAAFSNHITSTFGIRHSTGKPLKDQSYSVGLNVDTDSGLVFEVSERAKRSGLRPGDIIIAVGQEPASSDEAVVSQIQIAGRESRPCVFSIRRGHELLDVEISPVDVWPATQLVCAAAEREDWDAVKRWVFKHSRGPDSVFTPSQILIMSSSVDRIILLREGDSELAHARQWISHAAVANIFLDACEESKSNIPLEQMGGRAGVLFLAEHMRKAGQLELSADLTARLEAVEARLGEHALGND